MTGGATYNVFSMDKQYLTDYEIDGRWGATVGITGQYDINNWLGVRADINWTQKNYRKHRHQYHSKAKIKEKHYSENGNKHKNVFKNRYGRFREKLI